MSLEEAMSPLLLVVKVVQVVFPTQQAVLEEPYSGALRMMVVAPNVKSVSL